MGGIYINNQTTFFSRLGVYKIKSNFTEYAFLLKLLSKTTCSILWIQSKHPRLIPKYNKKPGMILHAFYHSYLYRFMKVMFRKSKSSKGFVTTIIRNRIKKDIPNVKLYFLMFLYISNFYYHIVKTSNMFIITYPI